MDARKFVNAMLQFQGIGGIKGRCITNVSYARDILTYQYSMNVEVRAVIHIFESNDSPLGVGHLVLWNNSTQEIIEVSYEHKVKKGSRYVFTIDELLKEMPFLKGTEKLREFIEIHTDFIRIADTINKGDAIITDKVYYDCQAEYVERFYQSKTLEEESIHKHALLMYLLEKAYASGRIHGIGQELYDILSLSE